METKSRELKNLDNPDQFEKAHIITAIMNRDAFYTNRILTKYSLEELKKLKTRIEGVVIH